MISSVCIRWVSFSLLATTIGMFGCRGSKTENDNREIDFKTESNTRSESHDQAWPNLFGPNRQSFVSDSSVPKHIDSVPVEKWRIDVGRGYSSPVVSGDRIFLSHRRKDKEIIECFSVSDGGSIWSHSFEAPYRCPYEYSDGPYSTPVLFEDRMIAVGQAGNTFCLEQNTGNIIWHRNLFEDFDMKLGEWPVAASGIVQGKKFIFNLGASDDDAGIIALDVATGKTAWTCTDQEAGHATPNVMTVNEHQHVVMVTSNGLVSIDPEVGKENWFVPFRRKKAETYNAVSPVIAGNQVCMVTGPGPGTLLVEVDQSNQPKTLWQNRRILDSQYTNLICVDGYLFGFTSMKQGGPELRCIDLRQEKLVWKWKASLGRAMMIAVNETIIVLGEKGNLAGVALSPQSANQLFRTEKPVLSAPCYSAPAYYDGKLFLRNEKHLVCFELPSLP